MKQLTISMLILLSILPFLSTAGTLAAQEITLPGEAERPVIFRQDSTSFMLRNTNLSINATGEILVPADQVMFQINITVTGLSPEAVFNSHKQRESTLVELIRDRDIDTEKLRFQPMNISSYTTRESLNGNSVQEYRTNQVVTLTLDDFDLYEEIQVYLIENGFDNFSGRFSSSMEEEAADDALVLALENAQSKARTIANSYGMTLRGITSVEHGTGPVVREMEMETAMLRTADSSSLMEFEQQVRVRSTVTVEFLAY